MLDRSPQYVIPQRAAYESIEKWIEAWETFAFNPKPPSYWMERKRSEGSIEGKTYSDAALGAIWFKRYDRGRRAGIWMQAPERDFIDAGYLVIW